MPMRFWGLVFVASTIGCGGGSSAAGSVDDAKSMDALEDARDAPDSSGETTPDGVAADSVASEAEVGDAKGETTSDSSDSSASCAELTGTWTGTRTTTKCGSGSAPLSFTLTQTGSKLTGTDERGIAMSGTVSGSSFAVATSTPDYTYRSYAGTLSGTCAAITGTWLAFECASGTFDVSRP